MANSGAVLFDNGTSLTGEELEDYCKKRGLCPLCAKVRIRKRVFRLFRRQKWEPLTIRNPEDGTFTVYKGYCVGKDCFSLDQAKRLLGEGGGSRAPRRRPSRRRFMQRSGSERSNTDNGDKANNNTSSGSYPPPELVSRLQLQGIVDNEPLAIVSNCADTLKTNNTISALDLSNVKLRMLDFETLADGLRPNTTLKSLILENCCMDDDCLGVIAQSIVQADEIPLVKLYLRTNSISNDGGTHLSKFLQQSSTLEKLDLSRNRIGSAGAIAVFGGFQNNRLTKVRCLNLSHNEIWELDDDKNNIGVRSFLAGNRTLKILNLEANFIHDEVAESIGWGMKKNEHTVLERLYLGWNGISDDGAIELASMMEGNATLRVLGLAENEIGNSGARALLGALDNNTTIREISGLWRNQIDRRFIIVAIRRLLMAQGERSAGGGTSNVRRSLGANQIATVSDPETKTTPVEQAPVPENGSAKKQVSDRSLNMVTTPRLLQEKENAVENLSSEFVDEGTEENDPSDKGTETTTASPVTTESVAYEDRPPPFDRLTVFQSAPLAFFDKNTSTHKAIPIQDFEYEANVLKESVAGTLGAKIEVVFHSASVEKFTSYFSSNESKVLHFSSYGHPEFLALENGSGSMQALEFEGLEKLIAPVKDRFQMVFVMSCFARETGNAFLNAGIRHVVCCQREEKFQDAVATEFAKSFYKALANNKTLKQAFAIAQDAVRASPLIKNKRRALERFVLLPENTENDHYHSIPVFFTGPVPLESSADELRGNVTLPPTPQHFVGREVDMYEIIEALRVDDVIRVGGSSGMGKTSTVAAVCRYILNRRNFFMIDDIHWLPAPEGVVPEEDTLYGDLCMAMDLMKVAEEDIWQNEEALDCRDRIEIELEGKRSVIVIDDREFTFRSLQDNLERFVSHLLNGGNVKVILISSRSTDEFSILSESTMGSKAEEIGIDIGYLDFKSSALLFGNMSKFIQSSGCPAAHSAEEFASLLEPPYIAKLPDKSEFFSKRRSDLLSYMGGGSPREVVAAASNMSKEEFIQLIGIANRPEVYVDTLGGLEAEIQRRTAQRDKAVSEKNYLRAMDLDKILEELEGSRSEFATLDQLLAKESEMKRELEEAVTTKQYECANDIKRDILNLKKQIMKERRVLPGRAMSAASTKASEVQAQVTSIINAHEADDDDDDLSANFTIDCDNRQCSLSIMVGSVVEFDHEEEASGIVCWTNESCDLKGYETGDRLHEIGGYKLVDEILSLPTISSSPWGPVRCGTGNAVFIGPGEYGALNVPCVILAVGPLSPSNRDDIEQDDGDGLHYVKTMLRSSYRSSLVLARHAELQALAVSIQATKENGVSYEETLRVGLKTLVEEVKFSRLRDLHIMASSPFEASKLIAIATEMGLQRT